jgi:flagellar hook-basal body complex protein FliE
MSSPISAASAYAAMQRVGASGLTQQLKAAAPVAEGGGVSNTADSARKAEAKMTLATAGKADLVDVVTAVAESEAALETLVAVRDRVIAAYEEIMRMPI